jgi:mannose-6-phosphate isomerase-like protein (cupin superfamily)
MLVKAEDARTRTFGDVSVRNYITAELCPELSVAVATVAGTHPETRSHHSTRAYYITDGSGTISVGDTDYQVKAGDAVLISRGTVHSIHGHLSYVLVNAPAFDPSQEQEAG